MSQGFKERVAEWEKETQECLVEMQQTKALPSELKNKCAELRSRGEQLQEELKEKMINRDIKRADREVPEEETEGQYSRVEVLLVKLCEKEEEMK